MIALTVVSVTGCGLSRGEGEANTPATRAAARTQTLCSLLEVSVRDLQRAGKSFADITAGSYEDDEATGDALAVLIGRYAYRGRYSPVIEFLRGRAKVQVDNDLEQRHRPMPVASAEVVENARELDRFLARGGCG